MRAEVYIGCLIASAASLPAIAQTPDPRTDTQITGYIYEPQAVPPTQDRISQLSLPQGFAIDRYAEGLYNPRMLAVSDDGTVYATQRTPGNLVMLKDIDHDGVVDTQKVILRLDQLGAHADALGLARASASYSSSLL